MYASATLFLVLLIGISTAMAEGSSPSESSSVYIVYTEKPNGEPEPHHLKTLTSVVGSEQLAKNALVYTYTNAATGFSAKLTPKQADDLSRKPGVLQVEPSRSLQLHSGASVSTLHRH